MGNRERRLRETDFDQIAASASADASCQVATSRRVGTGLRYLVAPIANRPYRRLIVGGGVKSCESAIQRETPVDTVAENRFPLVHL